MRHTNVHLSGPNDEDAHHNLSSHDNQVIQSENVCSEPPESLSYSLFQSHFQGSSTPNTQKIFLPKPIWEKLSKDQQQMIIDHSRSLPKSGSTHLSTPSLITSENGEPWIPSSLMEANMKSPSELLISSVHYSSKIISLNLITNTKIRLKIALDLPSVTPTLS